MQRRWRTHRPLDLRGTLAALRFGGRDASGRFLSPTEAWRATRTPEGPATTRIVVRPSGRSVLAEAWGPGAGWAVEHAPALVGEDDDDTGFAPEHPLLRDLHRRFRGVRIARANAVLEVLAPTVVTQKVIGLEAR